MSSSGARKRKPVEIPDNAEGGRPFLKWAGGKGQLLDELLARVPEDYGSYFEPFLGGGALLFALEPRRGVVSDINPELVAAYQTVRDNPSGLIKDLQRHVYEKSYYYRIRAADREPGFLRWSKLRRASRLIYLNRTCYNGLYRVNSRGQYNTPFGRYTNPRIVDAQNLMLCSRILQPLKVIEAGFQSVLKHARRNDFVYFDPPYVPISTTSSFVGYSCVGFGREDQIELRDICRTLDKRGVKVMISNSAAIFVRELYRGFRIAEVKASRAINSRAGRRGKISELIITNY